MCIHQNQIHYFGNQHHGSKFFFPHNGTPVPECLGAHYLFNGDRKDGYQVTKAFFTHVLLTAPFGLYCLVSCSPQGIP